MRVPLLLCFLSGLMGSASAEDQVRIEITGETEAELRESLMQATSLLVGGPEQSRYVEITIPTEALPLFELDGKPLETAFCSFEEGDGDRRIHKWSDLTSSGQTAEFIRYSLAFKATENSAAAVWTDLACHYRNSKLALVLRGHFIAKDLHIVEGYDVLLTTTVH